MKTRDEAIRDLADQAADQCEALANKMTAVIDGEDCALLNPVLDARTWGNHR